MTTDDATAEGATTAAAAGSDVTAGEGQPGAGGRGEPGGPLRDLEGTAPRGERARGRLLYGEPGEPGEPAAGEEARGEDAEVARLRERVRRLREAVSTHPEGL